MRDLLTDLENGPDPMRAAQESQRKALPKRFYAAVSVGEEPDGGFTIRLDGRPVRTPAKGLLKVPSRALAEALVAEWEAQGKEIDPSTMPLTRLVNVGLDGVAANAEATAAEVVSYAGSDLLCYRAEEPDRLVERQGLAWDPMLERFRAEVGARFFLSAGIRHVAQPEESLARVAALVPRDPLKLAALVSMTGLTGSALLPLAVLQGWLEPDAAWTAAHVDEDWNRELWGEDAEASARRAARKIEMDAAALLLRA